MTLPTHRATDTAPERTLQTGPDLFLLRVLATSDLHVHLTPWDYYTDRSSALTGLARTATLITAARSEMAALGGTCLLLDNGDFLNGSPLGDLEERRLNGTARGLADVFLFVGAQQFRAWAGWRPWIALISLFPPLSMLIGCVFSVGQIISKYP